MIHNISALLTFTCRGNVFKIQIHLAARGTKIKSDEAIVSAASSFSTDNEGTVH